MLQIKYIFIKLKRGLVVKMKDIHSFFVPIMGTSFTIDTPIKVAKYGISSVMSIGDDHLCESMRKFYSEKYGESYTPIKVGENNYRIRRITGYLNLVGRIIKQQITELKSAPFEQGSEITTYFELLPSDSSLKQDYLKMLNTEDEDEKIILQKQLRQSVKPGSADVNIMTKVDKTAVSDEGEQLPDEFSSALTALRAFAESDLEASMVFSAGFNRRLYGYVDKFADFFPDKSGYLKKKIILKVSDYRSAVIQGKFLAKKGIWISEYRIESGLNCGGHSFVANCALIGPVLEEFNQKEEELKTLLLNLCNKELATINKPLYADATKFAITVQGGVGTANEHAFLKRYYKVDGVGWGTPFLLVPQVSNVDEASMSLLLNAKADDLYLSDVSPLGVPFNTIYASASQTNRDANIAAGSPGSSCPKGFLAFNTEFTKKAICTASKLFQKLKIAQLKALDLGKEEFDKAYQDIVAKVCLCEDLAAAVFVKNKISFNRPLYPAICPGPNLAFFSGTFSLNDMIGHIYGKISLINESRPHLFVNELKLYIDHLAKEIKGSIDKLTPNRVKYFISFKDNLDEGIEYYKNLLPKIVEETKKYQLSIKDELKELKTELDQIVASNQNIFLIPQKA
jgi:hypothetical protein